MPGLPSISLADIPYLITAQSASSSWPWVKSLGSARAFAAKYRYEINPDQELIALGAANFSAGLFQGFTVDASLSSTATADEAGARHAAFFHRHGRPDHHHRHGVAPLFTTCPTPSRAIVIASLSV